MSSGISVGALAGLSALSSVLSFGGNLATSAINSSRSWKYTRRAMDYQDNLNRAYTHDSYGIMRKGLEDANYNPLLALGSSANSAIYSGSSINSDSDNGSQAVESALGAIRIRNENKLARSQVKLNQSQEDLNTQNTYKALSEEIYNRANSAVAEATEQKILNDIYWQNETNQEIIKKIRAETKFTNERARGFSASSSQTDSFDGGANFGFGTDGVNAGAKGGKTKSKSSSKSW